MKYKKAFTIIYVGDRTIYKKKNNRTMSNFQIYFKTCQKMGIFKIYTKY